MTMTETARNDPPAIAGAGHGPRRQEPNTTDSPAASVEGKLVLEVSDPERFVESTEVQGRLQAPGIRWWMVVGSGHMGLVNGGW